MIASSTAKIHGHYDFFTGLITLDKYAAKELDTVHFALNHLPPPSNTPEAIDLRDIRALVKHEITHFLDHTTTLWGLEFLFRRSCLIRSLKQRESDVKQRLDVYLLNAAELQMHSDLIKIHKKIPFDQCSSVNHELVQDKLHGPTIIIKFYQGKELVCDVPLSMLSLLEANAIANEYLSRFDDLAYMNQEDKIVADAAVERRLEKILNETDLAEYSVLIRLAKMHFRFFDTRQLLAYMSVLVNFCLNATIYSLGAISENIRHSFKNKRIGTGIWADLCRGMSRHVIAFKTILLMYNWIDISSPEKKQRIIEIMMSHPYQAIEMFWDEHRVSKIVEVGFEKDASLEFLREEGFEEEFGIASQAIKKNRNWLQRGNLEGSSFSEIASIDILLCDDSIVPYPYRIDFDVLNHSYKVIDVYTKLDEITKESIKKFHMPLEQASEMLEQILTKKEAAQARMRQKKSAVSNYPTRGD